MFPFHVYTYMSVTLRRLFQTSSTLTQGWTDPALEVIGQRSTSLQPHVVQTKKLRQTQIKAANDWLWSDDQCLLEVKGQCYCDLNSCEHKMWKKNSVKSTFGKLVIFWKMGQRSLWTYILRVCSIVGFLACVKVELETGLSFPKEPLVL